jgi:O-antigen/teichoic acid export membrane protein
MQCQGGIGSAYSAKRVRKRSNPGRREGGFRQSVGILAGGTILAQAITAGISPLLTRIYDPGQLGQFGLFTSFILVASVALSLRYELAIPSAASATDAARLAIAAILLVPVVAVVATGLYLGLISMRIAGYGALSPITALFSLVALTTFGIIGALRYWQVRTGGFAVVAQLAVVQSIGRAVSQVGLGLAGTGVSGLLIGEVVGRSLGASRLVQTCGRQIRLAAGSVSPHVLIDVLRRSYRFPLYGLPSSVINALALYVPLPLIVQLYGLEAGGAFILVQRVLSVPLAVIGSSVADVFHHRLAQLAGSGPHGPRQLVARSAVSMFAIGLPVALVVLVAGRPIFEFIFGSSWSVSGAMAGAMAPWALAQLVVYPVSRAVLVYDAQRAKLAFDAASLVGVVGSLTVASIVGLDAVGAVALLSALQTLAYGFLFVILWRTVSGGGVSAARS